MDLAKEAVALRYMGHQADDNRSRRFLVSSLKWGKVLYLAVLEIQAGYDEHGWTNEQSGISDKRH